jgi:hypothetical protein
MADESLFEHAAEFEQGEVSGNLTLGKLEAHYEELFAEVIEDGVITAEERVRLDRTAEKLGLDRGRLQMLERALEAAYEARNQISIRKLATDDIAHETMRSSLQPVEIGAEQRARILEKRVAELEARVAELEGELEEARSHIAVDIDLSDATEARVSAADDDPAELYRRLRRDPRDVETLHALFRAYQRQSDADRSFCVAHALVYLEGANDDERRAYETSRSQGLIKPAASLTRDAWKRLLFHPDEEQLTGEIFAIVVSAFLLGRVAMLRQAKALPALDPAKRLDPKTSTVQAVRCFGWAASILGMTSPPFFADPEFPGIVEMVPGVPPSSRLGKTALSGRSPTELAFIAGRHLAWYREEHFVRLLVPSIPDLEDVFLSALTIGQPGLPLGADVRRRVEPIAKAIEPILDKVLVDRLRGYFLRFVEEGGRTNLQRWAIASDHTATRAGFLLSNDLSAAHKMLELESPAAQRERMDDLLEFVVSDRYVNLRKQIGIAVGG